MTRHYIYVIVSILLFVPTIVADIVVLTSGEQLHVTILKYGKSSLQVHHKILGDFTIQTKDVASIETSTPKKDSDTPVVEKQVEEQKISWNQEIRFGLGYQNGQKESSDISLAYHANRTKDEHKVTFDVSYRLAESDDEKTLNRFASTWGNVWFQENSRWDIFTGLQFDWAEFQSWDQRLLGDLGVQYQLFKKKMGKSEFILSTRLGSGFRQEFNSEDDDLIPEGLLGFIVDWTVSDKQSFTADSTWHPDYKDTSNYRLVNNVNWNLQLDSKNKLRFSVGLHHEYNSVVDTGIKKSDLQITAGIKYLF